MARLRQVIRDSYPVLKFNTHLESNRPTVHITCCSFCEKTYPNIRLLVVSPLAGICDECTRTCQCVVTEELGK